MKLLVISANNLPASPSGPAYIAGAALADGHHVQVFDSLFTENPQKELKQQISQFNPDVVAVSIRLVHAYILDDSVEFGTRHLDLRPFVKQITDCIKENSGAHIILGGPGFNYYGPDWLDYLELDYGIRGEADFSFRQYLTLLENGADIQSVPGCVYRQNSRIHKVPREYVWDLDKTAFPAYEIFDVGKYNDQRINPGIVTKRGCEFFCTYCPYSVVEGKQYRLKSPQRVVDEIESIYRNVNPRMVTFCDNNFNAPNSHAVAICQEIIDRNLDISWGTGTIKPLDVSDEVLGLFKKSGCAYLNLSVESASSKMLKQMRRGSSVEDIRQALSSLSRSNIPFGVSLMFGAPGETAETISETLAVVDNYQVPDGIWVTIGISLWTNHQAVLADARVDGQLENDGQLFTGVNYVSPQLSEEYMSELFELLSSKEKYTVQVNKLFSDHVRY